MITNKQYSEYKKIANKICANDERTEDLFHDVLLQLSNNIKFTGLTETEKKYFFVKTISNQFYSNNSYFYRTYRRTNNEQLSYKLELTDEEYQEPNFPSIEWVREELEQQVKNEPDFWYNKGIFEMYLKHKKLNPIHKLTQIPKYSLRDTINFMKKWVIKKWNDGKT